MWLSGWLGSVAIPVVAQAVGRVGFSGMSYVAGTDSEPANAGSAHSDIADPRSHTRGDSRQDSFRNS